MREPARRTKLMAAVALFVLVSGAGALMLTRSNSASAPVVVDTPPPPFERQLPPQTTRPQGECRNSHDAACGPFHWDPAPHPNKPLTVDVMVYPRRPLVGETVTFLLTIADPDAAVFAQCLAVNFGNGGGPICQPGCLGPGPTRYGAWTPPDPFAGRGEERFTTSYDAPGIYTADFGTVYSDGEGPCAGGPYANPYGSTGKATVTIQVTP